MIRFLFLICFISFFSWSCYVGAQNAAVSPWCPLSEGLSFWEPVAPDISILGDSKIFILKVEPRLCAFQLLCSSEHGQKNRSADVWCRDFGVNVTVNAGMFSLKNGRTNKGYLRNYLHYNNPNFNGSYNVMMAMNPKDANQPSISIFDLTCHKWESIKDKYHTLCQGMRMIDCNGKAMAWDKRPGQACSMVVSATDLWGNIFFAFTRSPYTHQKMIGYLQSLIPDIRTTVYLEGGPEASLYIQTNDTIISKIGSYVSDTYENDLNDHFWEIPNVIGIKTK